MGSRKRFKSLLLILVKKRTSVLEGLIKTEFQNIFYSVNPFPCRASKYSSPQHVWWSIWHCFFFFFLNIELFYILLFCEKTIHYYLCNIFFPCRLSKDKSLKGNRTNFFLSLCILRKCIVKEIKRLQRSFVCVCTGMSVKCSKVSKRLILMC